MDSRPYWGVSAEPSAIGPRHDQEGPAWKWLLHRGKTVRVVEVRIAPGAIASPSEALPRDVARARESLGRSVVESLRWAHDPPAVVTCHPTGLSLLSTSAGFPWGARHEDVPDLGPSGSCGDRGRA